MWPFSKRKPIQARDAVRIALAFLQRHRVEVTESTPAHAVFQSAEDWRPYDRWLIYFDTHPGRCPPFTVVEVTPRGKPSAVPMI